MADQREYLEKQKGDPSLESWPETYINSETGKEYEPHHDDEAQAVHGDGPRYTLLKGGEGGGKSVAGIIKTLNRLKRGMSGIMVSPDLPHFRVSLWPEFRRWCPWSQVVEKHQRMQHQTWEPYRPFSIVFRNRATLYCGGIDDPGAWEGPNVNFAHFDEARRRKKADALKVLDGRVRIPGPAGELPQIWITTTPRKHWLFEYFGPPVDDDPHAGFKAQSLVVTLLTADNAANLEPGFVEKRALTLTAAEARVLLEAEWEDIEDTERFLPNMILWDKCKETLPALEPKEPIVVALDAATGRIAAVSDCFGIVAVSRHPKRRTNDLAVRFIQAWQAKPGGEIDFQGTGENPGPERVARWLCANYNVVQICYDPTELHDMAGRLRKGGVAWLKKFPQGNQRLEADRQLLDLIMQCRIAHDGNATLRKHIDNANRKLNDDGKRLRIVKREEGLKVDLAVALSMGSYETLRLNL